MDTNCATKASVTKASGLLKIFVFPVDLLICGSRRSWLLQRRAVSVAFNAAVQHSWTCVLEMMGSTGIAHGITLVIWSSDQDVQTSFSGTLSPAPLGLCGDLAHSVNII